MFRLYPYLLFVILASFIACDKVETPIPEPDQTIGSGEIKFPSIDSATINRDFKKTMVEEFTGHKCITCPRNTKVLLQKQRDNDERMLIIGVHAGLFANVEEKYPTDFNTEYSAELYEHYNMSSQPIPSILINRKAFPDFDDLLIFNPANWNDPIAQENENQDISIAMGVKADYIDSLDLFYIRVSAEAQTDIDKPHRLLILCVEDSIVAEQLDQEADPDVYEDKIVTDYIHRHVLRKKLSDNQSLSGDVLIESSLASGEWIGYELNAKMPENVVDPSKTSIVAMIIDPETEEIIQSEEAHTHIK